jgi:acetyl esterase/lipase
MTAPPPFRASLPRGIIRINPFSLFALLLLITPVSGLAEEYQTDLDIPYYNAEEITSDYQRERCVLDFYRPVAKLGFPTVIWFHGGGLTGGNKSIADRLKNQGIAVVAVNYRLSPHVNAPIYLEDSAAAVAWVFQNIAQYGGDPTKVFVSGSSAGGYLASMLGLDKSWLAAHDIDADQIAGLIPLAGQTLTHFTIRTERGLPRERPVIDELAPLHHVRGDTPPILLVTGDREKEMLGRYEENAYFYRMLKLAGHPDVRLMELDGYGHAPREPFYPLLLAEIKRVLKLHE